MWIHHNALPNSHGHGQNAQEALVMVNEPVVDMDPEAVSDTRSEAAENALLHPQMDPQVR